MYDFSTLNDKDLEVLVCDLLTKELSVNFQSFKIGKDKGIDLRYSTNSSENEIIVQVKHYYKSGYSQLFNVLKNSEKKKIDNLSPKRYILVSSVEMSPTDKEKIKNLLSPHILNTNDIIARDDLNTLLSKHNDLETKHFKLWFSNVNIIQKIVNNGIAGRSAFIIEKIIKNIGLYVANKTYDDGLNKLKTHKVVLITGIPGIGKTTLGNLITYSLLSKDFRLIYIDGNIKEAEDVFDNDPNVKQLFFFDDFLGSNYLEIINSRNTDKSIVNFIERVKASPNKYLILTTRTTILNQARTTHEKFKRANLDSLKYEIQIENYNEYDKARILYNHLYFNDIPFNLIEDLFKDKKYFKVIKHRNYNPRLIEFFTLYHNISHLKSGEYFDFIYYHLEHPEEIWESAINNQLSEEEKYLLFTLLSLGRNVNRDHLETAFEERIGNEVKKYGFNRRVNIFNISFRNLLDGYVTNSMVSQYSSISQVNYINPSLSDYLITFFNKNNTEKWRLIESFIFVEQYYLAFTINRAVSNLININNNEIRKLIEIANSKKLKSIYVTDNENISLRVSYLYYSYKTNDNKEFIDNFIVEKLKLVDWGLFEIKFFNDIVPIIESAINGSDLFELFKSNWDSIIQNLLNISDQESELERIINLYKKYDIDYVSYIHDDTWFKVIKASIDKVFVNEANEIIEQEQNEVYEESDFNNMKDKVADKYYELSKKYLENEDVIPNIDPIDDIDMNDLIEKNQQALDEAESHQDDWRDYRPESVNNDTMIEDLFSSFEK
ncbi:MAG: hypothetical protein AB7V36_10605 [Bacteroidales bacterium]